jgi:hypothetical protein
MPPTQAAIDRLTKCLRLSTPLIAIFDCPPSPEFEPLVRARGRACLFAFYDRWLEGQTVVFEKSESGFTDPRNGCNGAQIAFGLVREYPPFMSHFLTDGVGAPMGEGLKARAELAQEFIDRAVSPYPSGDTVLAGPLRLSAWEHVRSVTFLVDPDRLAALMTLATYWTTEQNTICAPFSSGCGLLWRELDNQGEDRAVIGCTDIAMRRYLPPEILGFTVTPQRFEKMLTFPDDAFLNRDWWNELMDSRERAASKAL